MKYVRFRSLWLIILLIFHPLSQASQSLTISTWNMEWLTVKPSATIPASQRTEKDFSLMATYLQSLDTDILAFQEVDSLPAIRRITGDNYHLILSDRALSVNRRHQFETINQFTGFAIRQGIPYENQPDIKLNAGGNSKLRFATYAIINPHSPRPIHLLAVHLKAGCSGKFSNINTHCTRLRQEGAALNQWIKAREKRGHAYIIMGDFNHNLAFRGDWLWQSVTQGVRRPPTLSTSATPAKCKVRSSQNPAKLHQFKSLIDHIIVSADLRVQRPEQVLFPTGQILSHRLSDHCAIKTSVR